VHEGEDGAHGSKQASRANASRLRSRRPVVRRGQMPAG
jgi:hypothetical protein